ncbi:unnamed protein product [Paramecium primaurelia]|uniref:Uncharacterized protein n=1 Tax=Paramecium primaurelia TaxID=5886 RepID=A0A8S1LUZ0_PARPR|nr:unnamed protein product [Paramecium primaurelia]
MSNDPYQWPFPKRTDLMNLQTIKNSKPILTPRETSNNHDVEGSVAKKCNYYHKQDFINKNDDIEGARSKSNIRPSNRADLQLALDDIKGTRPNIVKFQTSRHPLNPLEPQYKLPTFMASQPDPPKFIRDAHNIQDIQGAQPKQTHKKLIIKESEHEDIYGSHQIPRFQPKDKIDSLYVKDINDYLLHKTTRISNPLEPTYEHYDEKGNKIIIGNIEGSQSKPLYLKEQRQSLLIQDIDGTQPGSLSSRFLRTGDRKDYRETNSLADLQAAKSGSLKKGLPNVRYTNPLNPQYQIPGQKEIYGSVFTQTAQNHFTKAEQLDQFLKKK